MRKIIFSLLLFSTLNATNSAQTVKEVKIGNSIWMAENLNTITKESWYYNDDAHNGSKYGRLYSWEAAKKTCPVGWHLPSDQEWTKLIEIAGGSSKAGKALKPTGNLGFNLAFGGFSNVGGYNLLNFYGTYWTSTGFDNNHAWYVYFTSNDDLATKTYFTKTYGLSVRCVKNK